uniref:Uncharacterized protein n=1 Tax=Anopheles quadriannulatus TaxID=34691 RepID=A0A182XLH1_ANOQN
MGSKLSPLQDVTPSGLASSSIESFASTTECTPEPHAERPQTALQHLDHTIGIIWHCFDAFRQQFFTASPDSIEWAVDFLESSSTGSATDELHFVVAYLRCVQALVQLVFGKHRTPKAAPDPIEASLRESVSMHGSSMEMKRQQQLSEATQDPLPQDLIDELLRLYALLARYKEDVQQHREDTIELNQLQEIEQLLQELNDSFNTTDSAEEEWLSCGKNV